MRQNDNIIENKTMVVEGNTSSVSNVYHRQIFTSIFPYRQFNSKTNDQLVVTADADLRKYVQIFQTETLSTVSSRDGSVL